MDKLGLLGYLHRTLKSKEIVQTIQKELQIEIPERRAWNGESRNQTLEAALSGLGDVFDE